MLRTTLLIWFIEQAYGDTILVSGYGDQMTKLSLSRTEAGLQLEKETDWNVDNALTWLQKEGNILYGAHEVEEYNGHPDGAVSRWNISEDGLQKLENVILPSPSPAHLLVSLELSLAFTANYGGNSFTVLKLVNGALGDVVYQESFDAGCRDKSHPHQTVVQAPWVWVIDLGCDTIWHYKVEDGKVEKLSNTKVEDGLGPRHMVLHKDRQLMILLGELKSRVEVYR